MHVRSPATPAAVAFGRSQVPNRLLSAPIAPCGFLPSPFDGALIAKGLDRKSPH